MTVDALLSKKGYRHHERADELVDAANAGCRICLWICGMIYPFHTPMESEISGTLAPALRSADGDHNSRDYPYPVNLRYSHSRWGLSFGQFFQQ